MNECLQGGGLGGQRGWRPQGREEGFHQKDGSWDLCGEDKAWNL